MVMTSQPGAFGDVLRRYRVAAGLTQEELAERAHLSARGISNLERGVRRLPQRGTAELLADALGLRDAERAAARKAARRRDAGGVGAGAPAFSAPAFGVATFTVFAPAGGEMSNTDEDTEP